MMWRRRLAIMGVIVIAALLAFPLRPFVNQMIVLPLAYILWLLNILYLSLNQAVWWIGVAVIVLLILSKSILPEIKPSRILVPAFKQPDRGSVESLAAAIKKSHRGIYLKWLVANRLGKLAYQILLQREHGKPRSIFAPLTGEGWEAAPEVQQYLESGLHGSFADFPGTRRRYFAPPEKTPLDHDLTDVVEFLESRIESNGKPLPKKLRDM